MVLCVSFKNIKIELTICKLKLIKIVNSKTTKVED